MQNSIFDKDFNLVTIRNRKSSDKIHSSVWESWDNTLASFYWYAESKKLVLRFQDGSSRVFENCVTEGSKIIEARYVGTEPKRIAYTVDFSDPEIVAEFSHNVSGFKYEYLITNN